MCEVGLKSKKKCTDGTEISVYSVKTFLMVQQLNLRSSWDDVKEKLKENDISLTDEDLEYEPGGEDQLLERLQDKLHKNKDEIRRYIESISANDSKAG